MFILLIVLEHTTHFLFFLAQLKSYNIPLTRGGQPTSLTLCDVPPLGVSDTLHIINGHVIDGYKVGLPLGSV